MEANEPTKVVNLDSWRKPKLKEPDPCKTIFSETVVAMKDGSEGRAANYCRNSMGPMEFNSLPPNTRGARICLTQAEMLEQAAQELRLEAAFYEARGSVRMPSGKVMLIAAAIRGLRAQTLRYSAAISQAEGDMEIGYILPNLHIDHPDEISMALLVKVAHQLHEEEKRRTQGASPTDPS